MAKYQITYSCGHEATIQLFGKESDRQRKIEWLESEGLCPDCYKAKIAKEHAEASAKAYEAAKGMGMPELEGSEKQIAWEETIRQKALYRDSVLARIMNMANAIFADQAKKDIWQRMADKLEPVPKEKRTDALYGWYLDTVKKQTSAHWWIENRGDADYKLAVATIEAWQK